MSKTIWIITFLTATPVALALSLFLLTSPPSLISPLPSNPQVLAASTQVFEPSFPNIPTISDSIIPSDARALVIKKYLRRYKSPLEPHAFEIVETADKVGINPYLLIAIAQQESNLCKKIPPDSYNCWGYGIYGNKVTRFESFPTAISTIARGLKKNYLDKGLVTPEQIMTRYTPPSLEKGGAWAKGINQFLAEIEK